MVTTFCPEVRKWFRCTGVAIPAIFLYSDLHLHPEWFIINVLIKALLVHLKRFINIKILLYICISDLITLLYYGCGVAFTCTTLFYSTIEI